METAISTPYYTDQTVKQSHQIKDVFISLVFVCMIERLYSCRVDVCGYALAKLMTVIQVKTMVKPYSDDAMHIIFRERERERGLQLPTVCPFSNPAKTLMCSVVLQQKEIENHS